MRIGQLCANAALNKPLKLGMIARLELPFGAPSVISLLDGRAADPVQ